MIMLPPVKTTQLNNASWISRAIKEVTPQRQVFFHLSLVYLLITRIATIVTIHLLTLVSS